MPEAESFARAEWFPKIAPNPKSFNPCASATGVDCSIEEAYMSDASHTSNAEKDERTGRNPAGRMVAFDLDDEIRTAIKGLQSQDRGAVVLVKHRDLTVTLLALRKGAHLHEHSAKGSVSVQVIAGVIRLNASGEEKTLSSGSVCVIDREVPHAVEAMEDATMLLTAALPPQ